MNWKEVLVVLRDAKPDDEDPIARLSRPSASTMTTWPNALPRSPTLETFWSLCDGGVFNADRWFGHDEAVSQTQEWRRRLHNWDGDDKNVLTDAHIVFGEDAGGCPLVLDTNNGNVRCLQFDGGGWEDVAASLEAFLDEVFMQTNDTTDQ